LDGLAHAILKHRSDILFLGDLGIPRNTIGKLRQILERKLGDEYFLLTDVSAPCREHRSTGIAAVIHCSLAKSVKQEEFFFPEGMEKANWTEAVAGSLWKDSTTQTLPATLPPYLASDWLVPTRCLPKKLRAMLLTPHCNGSESCKSKALLIGDVDTAPL
jgi:hypothetical protein